MQLDHASGSKVVGGEVKRQAAPARTRAQHGVLGAEIRQSPGRGRPHPVVLVARTRRAVGQHKLQADARLLGLTLTRGQQLSHRLANGVGAYLVTTSGRVSVNDVTLDPQDGAAITDLAEFHIVAHGDTEVLLVETRQR